MSDPIIFISRNRVKEGMFDAFKKHYIDSIPPVVADKPGTLVQLAYLAEDSADVIIVRLFPNADALDHQIQGADERSKKTYEYIEPISIEIFGIPYPTTLERMKKIGGSGIVVTICPNYAGGFIRSLDQ